MLELQPGLLKAIHALKVMNTVSPLEHSLAYTVVIITTAIIMLMSSQKT